MQVAALQTKVDELEALVRSSTAAVPLINIPENPSSSPPVPMRPDVSACENEGPVAGYLELLSHHAIAPALDQPNSLSTWSPAGSVPFTTHNTNFEDS